MQHLDEGTIHSWLDGALAPDDAARVEAHVTECAQCTAVVAEARGFIAASSRILTALDNAPRGVIPAAAPGKRIDPMVWRIAATLLIVAGGTLVVARNRGADEQLKSAKTEAITFSSAPVAATTQAPIAAVPPPVSDQASARTETRKALPIAKPEISARRMAAGAGKTASTADLLKAPVPEPRVSVASRIAATAASPTAAVDAAAEPQPLRVVGTPRRIGAKVTLYEVAPGDTVTLTESVAVQLNSIVMRGVASNAVPMAQTTREKSAAAPANARTDVTATSPAESRAVVGAAAGVPAAPPLPPAVDANPIHTITWTDSTTGSTLSLSGRMPEARLQEIRIRIERERAAAAKKNP